MAAQTLQRSMTASISPPKQMQSMDLSTSLPKIPIVSHLITDEDIGSLAGAKLQPVNLTKVVKLLSDPHSAMLYDRHESTLGKLIRHYQNGFLMKDLVFISKILNICADKIEEQDLFVAPMVEILRLCGLPFLKEKTSDETVYEQIATESVSQLAYLMRVPDSDVRLQLCNTLKKIYTEKQSKQSVQRHKPVTLSYNQNLIQNSDVSESLVKSMALLEDDVDVKIAVLSVLQILSKDSVKNCTDMLKAEAAHRLCSRLMDPDPSGQVLFRSVDILWNMLECDLKEEVACQMNSLICVSQLRDAFVQQMTQGYSHYDRQLRNDLLAVASLVATYCIEAPFIETGFVKQLVLFCTFQEVKSHNVLVKHLKLMTNHEDFELKKQLMNILVVLSRDPSVIHLLSEARLLLALFTHVKANEPQTGPREWTVAQAEELQLHAIASLATLGPLMIEDYMTCQGSTRLLLLLEWCIGTDAFGGQGNAFHGSGGRGNKRAQMRYCLRLIRAMVSTGVDAILQDFTDQGAINQITNILTSMLDTRNKDDAIDIEMQCDMLFILSCICENDLHRKELFGEQGVNVVVEYLKIHPNKLSSGLGHHKLMLAAVDAIWCAVYGCYITEDFFLEKEGVFLMIDILESGSKNMNNIVLGCLVDLCENPKAISHINAWRGKQDITAAHLFCEIWREEERILGVRRDSTGAIQDISVPLMGTFQFEQGIRPLPASCPSQSIVDVSENMRAKIYAIFCRIADQYWVDVQKKGHGIGFVELPGLETKDLVTLTIIEHYLDLKLGEVWTEVVCELEQEDIRPVTPDREAIAAITRAIEDRAADMQDAQKKLVDAQNQQDLIDEQELYAEIRENHRQKEKTIKDFQDFVSRTSNYGLLRAAKERQEISVDASRVQTNYKEMEEFHTTDLPHLHTTTFSGRFVAVESTPLELTGGPLANYDPIKGSLRPRSCESAQS